MNTRSERVMGWDVEGIEAESISRDQEGTAEILKNM
jgi:hypothetical protein